MLRTGAHAEQIARWSVRLEELSAQMRQRLELGSAGYTWDVLPRVRLAAVYWEGDEDLPSQASVLFDEASVHHMTTDGLAVLGSRLVDRLVRG